MFLFQTDGSGTHVRPCWVILLLAGWGHVVRFGWQLASLQGMRRLWLHLRPWWACSESWLSCPTGSLHVFSWLLHIIYPVGSYSLTQWLRHQECVIYGKKWKLLSKNQTLKLAWCIFESKNGQMVCRCHWTERNCQRILPFQKRKL